jgi:hypothetical protein
MFTLLLVSVSGFNQQLHCTSKLSQFKTHGSQNKFKSLQRLEQINMMMDIPLIPTVIVSTAIVFAGKFAIAIMKK